MTVRKFRYHPVPHNYPNSEMAKVGRIRMMSQESSGGDGCPAYENQVIRSIHSSHPCHHQSEDAERWEQADASQEGFCFLFFFNGGNSLLIEISSRKILGSYFESDYKKVLKHFFDTLSLRHKVAMMTFKKTQGWIRIPMYQVLRW